MMHVGPVTDVGINIWMNVETPRRKKANKWLNTPMLKSCNYWYVIRINMMITLIIEEVLILKTKPMLIIWSLLLLRFIDDSSIPKIAYISAFWAREYVWQCVSVSWIKFCTTLNAIWEVYITQPFQLRHSSCFVKAEERNRCCYTIHAKYLMA